MAVSITLNFDDSWAARLGDMVAEKVDDAQQHPVIIALIESLPGIDSVDDLTLKQKAKLWILFQLLCNLAAYEGRCAALSAQQTIIADIEANFPLEVGEP